MQLHAFTPEVVLQHFVGPSILLLDSSPLVTLDVTHDDFEKHARPRTISAVLNQNTHVRTHMHMYTYIHTHMCPHAHNLIHHTNIAHPTRTRTLMHNKVLFVKRDRLNRVSKHTACHLPSSFPSSHKCTHAHTKRTTKCSRRNRTHMNTRIYNMRTHTRAYIHMHPEKTLKSAYGFTHASLVPNFPTERG